MYYFCNDYRITEDGIELRDEYVRPLPEDFFRIQTPSQLQINVSAVVGMNGDGKSTLIELMMRLVNNCAKHYRLTDKENNLLCPGITGPATLKYRLEDEMIAEYVAQKQKDGDTRNAQDIAVEYNDNVIYPDKVRLNSYYYHHYSFIKDIQMILCTVLGKKMEYAGEVI